MKKLSKVLACTMLALGMGLGNYSIMVAEEITINLAEDMPLRIGVEEIKYIEDKESLADITIQERRVGCLTESRNKEERTITLSLEGTSFKFTKLPQITLKEGFKGLKQPKIEYLDSNNQLIGIMLPYDGKPISKGKMILSNICITGLEAATGDVYITVGSLFGEEISDILVAKVAEYGVILEPKKLYEVKAGGSQSVTFTVKEMMPDSLTSNGRMEFYLDKGYFKAERSGEINNGEVLLNGVNITSKVTFDSYGENGYITGFDIDLPEFNTNKKNVLTFSNFKICAGVDESGEINLTIGGRGVPEEVTTTLAEIKAGNITSMTSVHAKVGVKGQRGGKLVIAEQSKGNLELGYIKLKFEGSPYVTYDKSPIVEVTSGDLGIKNLGWIENEENVLLLKVTKKSKRPSTIEIKDFTFSVNRMAPDGIYDVIMSGSAISPADETCEVKYEGFMEVSLGKTFPLYPEPSEDEGYYWEDNRYNTGEQVTEFVVGSKNYKVNGIINQMDAAPFIQNGRTMVPIRYVAVAAGINDDQITYKDGIIAIQGEKTIYLYLNSRNIIVDGYSLAMATEPVVRNQRTYVPISEIANILNLQVIWYKNTQTATFIQ